MTLHLCFIDTETTGLHTNKQIWEVAIIRREFLTSRDSDDLVTGKGYRETRYEAFLPVDLSNADLFGLNVGRFYERHPYGRFLSGRESSGLSYSMSELSSLEQAQDVAESVARFTHGCRFIGGAPSFDAEVLGTFLRKHGLLPTWHHRLVDTHDLLTGWLLGRRSMSKVYDPPLPDDIYSMKKDEKVSLIGLEPLSKEEQHTAMGDAQHEADIWDAIFS